TIGVPITGEKETTNFIRNPRTRYPRWRACPLRKQFRRSPEQAVGREGFPCPRAVPEANAMTQRTHGPELSRRLTEAVAAGDAAAVDRWLGTGADPNSRDPAGVLVLAIAASRKDVTICRSLLRGGADP